MILGGFFLPSVETMSDRGTDPVDAIWKRTKDANADIRAQ